MVIKMIAAVGKNMELGRGNHLIWYIPKDMRFFRKCTLNHKIVMGRKTYESIGKPLQYRENIVLTHRVLMEEGITVISDIGELDKLCGEREEVYIIGGESIYRQFLPLADEIILTQIEDELEEADAYFPEIDEYEYDVEVEGEYEYNELKYTRKIYTRK